MYHLKIETAQDQHEVEALFDLCFAPGREALSSYRLRDDVASVSELNHVARDEDGVLAGAIRFWPVLAGEAAALLLGPIAVHPTRQGEGLAGDLIHQALALAALQGWARVILVGDEPYYGRFGFERLSRITMPPPTNPERVLGHALHPDAWRGISGDVIRWSDPSKHID
ncbi:MAG: N-acetyltransferase [Paracoccaceae bacterium]|nr:N-acetyltransferase [Paracoccaceae bacterium]